MMLTGMIIGAAVLGCIGLGVEYFFIDSLISNGFYESKQNFWLKLLVAYILLLIPPYIMSDRGRTEVAVKVGQATILAVAEIGKWISIGILIAIGFHAIS